MKRSLPLLVLALLVAYWAGAAQPPSSPQPAAAQAPAQTAVEQQPPAEPAAAQQGPPQQGAVQQPPAQQPPAQQAPGQQGSPPAVLHYDTGPLMLVGVVLLVLGGLFYLMLSYSNRIAQTGPLGTQVTDALRTIKQQQIVKALDEKWSAGGYHQELLGNAEWLSQNLPPPMPDDLAGDYSAQIARRQLLQSGRVAGGAPPPGLGGPGDVISKPRAEYVQSLRNWETSVLDQAARQRYATDRSDSFKEARESGIEALDFFDFASLWGQGPEFVLQFTAVVTIIFAVVALGILQRLGEDQAGTILAAIAGYVLGQAARNPRAATPSQRTQADATAKGREAPQGALPVVSNARVVPTTP